MLRGLKERRTSTVSNAVRAPSALHFLVCADQRADDVMIVRGGRIAEVRARLQDQGPAMLGEMPSDRGRQCMGQQLADIRACEKGRRALLVHVFDRSHMLTALLRCLQQAFHDPHGSVA